MHINKTPDMDLNTGHRVYNVSLITSTVNCGEDYLSYRITTMAYSLGVSRAFNFLLQKKTMSQNLFGVYNFQI